MRDPCDKNVWSTNRINVDTLVVIFSVVTTGGNWLKGAYDLSILFFIMACELS